MSSMERVGQVPPNALEAERAVLGGILLENDAMNVVLEEISAEDFYSEANGKIFEAMTELFRRSQPVDHVTLRESLVHSGKLASVGGDDYLLSLSNTIPSVANIQAHAQIIREKAIVRALQSARQAVTDGFPSGRVNTANTVSASHRARPTR